VPKKKLLHSLPNSRTSTSASLHSTIADTLLVVSAMTVG
jgi:hypothetical protein